MRAVGVTRVGAHDVVIGDDEDRPAAGAFDGIDVRTVLWSGELLEAGHHQVHGHLQFVVVLAVVVL